jgi:O-methyltransferase involved in polyketide biosynthesis
VDVTRPSIARVYDYLLGGKDNFPADRADAARLMEVSPELARLARQNREFLGRAVRWVAAQGVDQFLDLGSGLPTTANTHQVAQSVRPGARVVYLDRDPVVVIHGTALLTGDGTTAAVRADITRPRSVLAHPEVTGLIDFARPAAIVAAMVLHFLPAAQARQVMRDLAAALAPGSYLIISVGCGVPAVAQRLAREYAAGSLHNHSADDIASFFAGAPLCRPPGLVFAGDWEPEAAARPPVLTGAHVLAGVARLPGPGSLGQLCRSPPVRTAAPGEGPGTGRWSLRDAGLPERRSARSALPA